jgi:hypothetical protein
MSSNHLTDLLVSLADAKVKFIICGGVAAVLQGVERMTLDLDISVDMEPKNLRRFLEVIKNCQLEPRVPISTEFLLDPKKIQILIDEKNARVFTFIDEEKPWRQVDIFLTDDYSYQNLVCDTEEIIIGGRSMLVLSKECLIQMKKRIQPPRHKDLLDLHQLEALRKKNND